MFGHGPPYNSDHLSSRRRARGERPPPHTLLRVLLHLLSFLTLKLSGLSCLLLLSTCDPSDPTQARGFEPHWFPGGSRFISVAQNSDSCIYLPTWYLHLKSDRRLKSDISRPDLEASSSGTIPTSIIGHSILPGKRKRPWNCHRLLLF